MTVAQQPRPRGRRPGHDDTRGAIASCARQRFETHGYDGTSLRAIAREAGVDPALVHHYFGCKAELFVAVCLGCPTDLVERLNQACDGDPAGVGVRFARTFLDVWESPRYSTPLQTFLTPESTLHRRLIHEFVAREFFCRIATQAGHPNSLARSQFAASALFGIVAGRRGLRLGSLQAMSTRSVAEALGRVLQELLVSEW